MKLLMLVVVSSLLAGCMSMPSQICSTYEGIRAKTPNFIYCKDGTVYDIKNGYYLDRGDK